MTYDGGQYDVPDPTHTVIVVPVHLEDLFDRDYLGPGEFVDAVLHAKRENQVGDPDAYPYIYSIEVSIPRSFHVDPSRFGPDIRQTSIPEGYLYADQIYNLSDEQLKQVASMFAYRGSQVKVKFLPPDGDTWERTKIRFEPID